MAIHAFHPTKQAMAALLLSAASLAANAALIDHGTYVADTVNGLDWLKPLQTYNMSFNTVSSQLGAGGLFAGWQYATGLQWNAMVISHGAVPDEPGCAAGVGVPEALFCMGLTEDPARVAAVHQMLEVFGSVFNFTEGILGRKAGAATHYTAGLWEQDGYAQVYSYITTPVADNTAHPYRGSWLVRVSEVPVPAGIWLFGSAMVGLGLMGRKAKVKA